MTSTWISKALLWVAITYPFANAAIQKKLVAFANAYPRLATASAPAARLYVKKLGLIEGSPWESALQDSIDYLEQQDSFNRARFVNDLARASSMTAIQAPGNRVKDVRGILDRLLPK